MDGIRKFLGILLVLLLLMMMMSAVACSRRTAGKESESASLQSEQAEPPSARQSEQPPTSEPEGAQGVPAEEETSGESSGETSTEVPVESSAPAADSVPFSAASQSGGDPPGQGSGQAASQGESQIQEAREFIGSHTAKGVQDSYPINVESVQLVVANETNGEGGYGASYAIDRYDPYGKKWDRIPLDISFPEDFAILQAGESHTITVKLYQNLHDYLPGRYRVVLTGVQGSPVVEFQLG